MAAARQWLRALWGRRERPEGGANLDQWRPSFRLRLVRAGAVVLVAVGVCAFLDLKGSAPFEHYAYGLRMCVYARRNVAMVERAKQIVLVTVSDNTFHQVPGPQIPRNYHAKVIRDLTRAGAKAIVFDLYFSLDRPGDQELAAAAKASGRVLWACPVEDADTPEPQLTLPNPCLRRANPRWAHIVLRQDPDGPAFDRIPPVIECQAAPVEALSLRAAIMVLGLENEPLQRVGETWHVGPLEVPVDENGEFRITYSGKEGETFTPISYESLYAGAADEDFYRENRFFRDKIILIGDTRALSKDRFNTPVGSMSGVEIHAHAIATLLGGGFVREAPTWANLVLLCLLPALVCPLTFVCRLRWAVPATACLALGYFIANAWLFVDRGLWLHLVAPLAAVAIASVGLVRECGPAEKREKNRMRGLLERYVSPQVAARIIANPDAYVLGGEEVTATVLFSDIRGFTAMAEKLPPAQVAAHLNEYFQAMTDAVFRHDGALDKYMGDCIMALFGVPVPRPDHARRAVATALDMQVALRQLQARWRARGLPVLQICIGVNTGPMMVGNVGSQQHLDFTAIGDAVNVAQRVESLNRELGTRLLITEATYQAVGDVVQVRGPFRATLAGRSEEAVVYEVVGWGVPDAR
jgi:adenylate cyclase